MEDSKKRKKFLFISCEEAFEICDKAQYGEASPWEKLKLNIRYLWCSLTKIYVKRNKKLTKALKTSQIQSLHASEREQLLERFNQQLQNKV